MGTVSWQLLETADDGDLKVCYLNKLWSRLEKGTHFGRLWTLLYNCIDVNVIKPPQVCKIMSYMKPVRGAKKVGDHCNKPWTQWFCRIWVLFVSSHSALSDCAQCFKYIIFVICAYHLKSFIAYFCFDMLENVTYCKCIQYKYSTFLMVK